ncbi:hypothetical protein [Sphingomonas sp. 10B4]|uniref:hypothetical protein n=1 Tax=Sphingomonas sp. 10B4 TaxID=3048575 RepID=UPI002AB4AA19|nr:hypothetical protein [Sphingomonas sp. 10B4]MDY7525505.1 hypothetical protein [Sphingomonas sp. 10B4]MEB0281451.1 hypothetical protein [Sphingomonas sp. 10B4]
MSQGGFYLMHRGWQDNPVFRNEEYSRRDAFVWLIEEAAYKPTRVHAGSGAISLNRGQLSHSLRFMAKAWQWDEARVRRFIASLVREGIIDAVADAGQTVITICNYETYQSLSQAPDAADDASTTQQRRSDDAKKNEVNEVMKEVIEATPQLRTPAQPVTEAFAIWNENAASVGWPTIAKHTASRQAAMRARLRDDGLDGWKAGIARARASPFLTGSPPPSWFTFDFIVKPGNFAKVIEGNYDASSRQNGNFASHGSRPVDGRIAAFREMSTGRQAYNDG